MSPNYYTHTVRRLASMQHHGSFFVQERDVTTMAHFLRLAGAKQTLKIGQKREYHLGAAERSNGVRQQQQQQQQRAALVSVPHVPLLVCTRQANQGTPHQNMFERKGWGTQCISRPATGLWIRSPRPADHGYRWHSTTATAPVMIHATPRSGDVQAMHNSIKPNLNEAKSNTEIIDSNKTNKSGSKSSSGSNIFLDHLGTIFLTIIAVIVATLVRSYFSTQRRTALRDALETASHLDPLELQELRQANADTITITLLRQVARDLWQQQHQQQIAQSQSNSQQQQQHPEPVMAYPDFVRAVQESLQRHTEGRVVSLERGHLLDRVILAVLEQSQRNTHHGDESFLNTQNNKANDDDNDGPVMSLSFWLTLLSLTLAAPVSDRIQFLYYIMSLQQHQPPFDDRNDDPTHDHFDGNDMQSTSIPADVEYWQIVRMIDSLQALCQLVPDTQIQLKSDAAWYEHYPLQQWERANAQQMIQHANMTMTPTAKNTTGTKNHATSNTDTAIHKVSPSTVPIDALHIDDNHTPVDLDVFTALLRSKSICAWGECYHKKRFV